MRRISSFGHSLLACTRLPGRLVIGNGSEKGVPLGNLFRVAEPGARQAPENSVFGVVGQSLMRVNETAKGAVAVCLRPGEVQELETAVGLEHAPDFAERVVFVVV